MRAVRVEGGNQTTSVARGGKAFFTGQEFLEEHSEDEE
ncbi:hypothetical protein GGP99_000859 [Salinibacter ruber]|uniref:Uncharacterized protein n=1 Tax=Salinibacter ruber TaxID=146919 RepID=A0AAW5P4L8_9BACT|nr:hypothetical protein [Salinibacter ruber]